MSRAGNVLENPVTGERAVAGEQQISRERADDQPAALRGRRIQTRESMNDLVAAVERIPTVVVGRDKPQNGSDPLAENKGA